MTKRGLVVNSFKLIKKLSDSGCNVSFVITLKNFDIDDPQQISMLKKELHADKIVSCPKQIHSAKFYVYPNQKINQGDGIITRDFQIAVGVRVADCPAVSLYDGEKNILGIFHCGWKGLRNKILLAAVQGFKSLGSKVNAIQAVIYPHICQNCYEVGEELTNYFNQGSIKCINKKYFFSLQQEIETQLSGVGIEKINRTDYCTRHQPDLFHSYRRYRQQGLDFSKRMYALAIQER